MKRCYSCSLILLVVLIATGLNAAVPPAINYQGLLTDAIGKPVSDGSYSVQFLIYDAAVGGTSKWAETQNVTTSDGLFAVLLGSVSPITDNVFSGSSRYLAVKVGTDPEIFPRTMLITVPWAYRVSTVDSASGGTITGDVNISGKATIGPGHTNTGVGAFVAGEQNFVSGLRAVVSGGNGNDASGSHSAIGGGADNVASGSESAVAGGSENNASGLFASVGGGDVNYATGESSVISGGSQNGASEYGTTVSGGALNVAEDSLATVGGGKFNFARGAYSVIAGGGGSTLADSNSALGDHSTISGGFRNVTNYQRSTIGGGNDNTATSHGATIGGGAANTAHYYATVGGGAGNKATAEYSTVGGGREDSATGYISCVPGGEFNKAAGYTSFAAGQQAKAIHDGAFVWADKRNTDFSSSVNNEFSIRATGGTRIYSNLGLTSGVLLSAGGSSWSAVSDSTLKRNIREVDYQEVLNKVADLPISQWSYEAQDESIEHIGPMAQDFYRLFSLGEDDKHINTLDPDGIALAAIKALYKENKELKNKLNEMAKRLDKLENH